MILEAPDVYFAAAVMNIKGFCNGSGARPDFINQLLASDDTSKFPDLARKLKLLT